MILNMLYQNKSDTAYVTEVITSFPLSKYCQTTEGMTNISWQNDDGTNSFACPDSYKFFYYNANLVTTIWYGGNTWIGLTGGSEQITYNRRDTYVNTFYHQQSGESENNQRDKSRRRTARGNSDSV